MKYYVRCESVSWYKNGRKESPCDGAILEEIDEYGCAEWVVDIDTLEELMEFIRENGPIVICQADPKHGAFRPTITLQQHTNTQNN